MGVIACLNDTSVEVVANGKGCYRREGGKRRGGSVEEWKRMEDRKQLESVSQASKEN